MRISDWSSDVCSSDLIIRRALQAPVRQIAENAGVDGAVVAGKLLESKDTSWGFNAQTEEYTDLVKAGVIDPTKVVRVARSEEHTSELQSLMRISYAVFCLKKKKTKRSFMTT